MDRRHQPVQALLDLLGERPRLGVGQVQGPGAVAASNERLLLGDDAAIPIKRGVRCAKLHGLLLALHVSREFLEIFGDPRRPLGPRRRVARVAQHHRAHLEPHERRDRLAGGGSEVDRGDGAGRDLPVDGHEFANRVEAEETDDREHDDDEDRGQEGSRGEPHVRRDRKTRTISGQSGQLLMTWALTPSPGHGQSAPVG